MPSDTIEYVNNIFKDKNRISIIAELPEDVQKVALEIFDMGIITGFLTLSLEEYYGAIFAAGVSACFPDELRKQLEDNKKVGEI
jgi:hypothetical protein